MLRLPHLTLLLLIAAAATAQIISSDVAVDPSGVAVADPELIVEFGGAAVPILQDALPDGAESDGYDYVDGAHYFSLESRADLSGLSVAPADIVRYADSIFTLEFDAAAEGVPDGMNVDAVDMLTVGSTLVPLISFDTTLSNPSGTPTAQDEDVVSWAFAGLFTMRRDLTGEVPEGADLDGCAEVGCSS